jgi:hypothetical protein
MTGPGARRITETIPGSQTEEPTGSDREVVENESTPSSAAVAEESAAIYPDTNEGRPTPEEIAVEAYRMYMARGGQHGHDLEDWLEAERRVSDARNRKA